MTINQVLKKIATTSLLACTPFIFFAQQTDTIPDNKTKWEKGLTPTQQLIANTGEDLLTSGSAEHSQTLLSGYGQASFQRDFQYVNNKFNLDRIVLFVGHQFNNNIAFFSELEIADARIESGSARGEVGMEQAFLKFSINPRQYFIAGLFIPRIGILNENHLPINYYGTERAMVEQLVIPSTWRELGVAFYGQMSKLPITYSIGVVNGLNSKTFVHGTGLTGGKGGGQMSMGNNLAVTGSAKALLGDFQIQASGYFGGSVSAGKYESDSLGIKSGLFTLPVMLGEFNVQYDNNGWGAKLLASYVRLNGANAINKTYANNTPESMYGVYAEVSYNIFENFQSERYKNKSLVTFLRLEQLDLNASIPQNGIYNGTLKQTHVLWGFNYFPVPNVVLKADVRWTQTGPFNKALYINPPPVMRPYAETNTFLNIGIGYAF